LFVCGFGGFKGFTVVGAFPEVPVCPAAAPGVAFAGALPVWLKARLAKVRIGVKANVLLIFFMVFPPNGKSSHEMQLSHQTCSVQPGRHFIRARREI
jgi:hypothetical protein